MCLGSLLDEFDDEIEVYHEDDSLKSLIKKYLRLADFFNSENVFILESNIKFGRLNNLEHIIMSKRPKTKVDLILYDLFLEKKRYIDSLIITPKSKIQANVVPLPKTDDVEPLNTIIKVKKDKSKKKYRSALVITRSDTTGFSAAKMELNESGLGPNLVKRD
jgi:hypothetical protein